MKYTLILILACVPLAGLTVVSVLQAIGQSAATVTVKPFDPTEANAVADQARERADGDQSAARQWTGLDPFDPHASELAGGKSASAQKVVEAWQRAQVASDLVAEAARGLPPESEGTDDAPPHVAQQLTALQTLVASLRKKAAGKVENTEGFFLVLERQVERLTQRKKNLEDRAKIDEALTGVDKLLSDRTRESEEKCLQALGEEPLTSARDPRQRARIEQDRRIADYRLKYRDLYKRVPSPAADRKLFRDYNEFVRLHPDPPTHVEEEAHENLLRKKSDLQMAIALDDLDHSADLQSLVANAARLIGQLDGDANAKARVRAQVIHWLATKGLPEMQPPDSLLGKKEATSRVRRYIGYFDLPTGVVQWRFWPTQKQKDALELRRGIEQIASDEFEKLPGQPMYVQLAQGYNAERDKLFGEGGSKDEWSAFARRCDEMEAQLIAYRQRWGVTDEVDKTCRDWTFGPPAKAAREIIKQWENYRTILEK